MFKISKKSIIIILWVITVSISGSIVYSVWLSPKAQVRKTIEASARAFLVKDKIAILGAISPDFDTSPLTKYKIDTSLAILFREFEKIKVILSDHNISLISGEAVGSLGVIVLVSRAGEQFFMLGSFGKPDPVSVKLKKQKKWQITGVGGLNLVSF